MAAWTTKRKIMRRYNITARIYDRLYAEEQAAKIEAALKSVTLGENTSVLDAGCGTGLLFDYITSKTTVIVGLDLSKNMLVHARDRGMKHPNAHLILADVDKLPLKEDVFEYVFAMTLVQNTPSPKDTLRELRIVSKKNVAIIVTGLKRVYSREDFEKLLSDAGLRILAVHGNDCLKCYVAICTTV